MSSRSQRLLALARMLKERAKYEETTTRPTNFIMQRSSTPENNISSGDINNLEASSTALSIEHLNEHDKQRSLYQWPHKFSSYEYSNSYEKTDSDVHFEPIIHETKSSMNGFDFDMRCLLKNQDSATINSEDKENVSSSNNIYCDDLPEWENSDDSIKDPDFRTNSNDSGSDEEIETFNIQKTSTRENKKLRRQKSRNNGKSYKTSSGKFKHARISQPFGICRSKCQEKIPFNKIQSMFNHYWSLGSYDQRILYIGSLLVIEKKKCNTLVNSNDRKRNRENTVKYFLEYDGNRINVCRTHFTQCFAETESFIKSVISKKLSCPLLPFKNCRGKRTPVNKINQEKEEEVRYHIQKFPAYESHYSRRDTSKKYIHGSLNLATMHRMYKEEVAHPVGMTKYAQIFHTMNLKFKAPKLDTCATCDTFLSKIKVAQSDEEKTILNEQKNMHLEKADFGYDQKKIDKENAKQNESMKAFAFDLQQCLPTPFLRNSVSFYKRQLWTFNLTIHDLETNSSGCFMWHEGTARRGGNEIASCIFKHLKSLPSSNTKITFYSDSCSGQNKNSYVAAMFLIFLKDNSTIDYIDHKFLEPGHTHMECDTDHALIERKKSKSNVEISVPRDWYQFIDGINFKIKVFEMKQTDFFNFCEMSKTNLNWKRSNLEGEKFIWNAVRWIRYTNDTKKIFYKTSLNPEEPFKILALAKRGASTFTLDDLKIIKDEPNISSEKKKDLMDLMQFINPEFHEFYISLRMNLSEPNTHPDLESEEDEN